MGADDYITKPFRPRELLARIGAGMLRSVQTLLFGLPAAGVCSWLICRGMIAGGADVSFAFPWASMDEKGPAGGADPFFGEGISFLMGCSKNYIMYWGGYGY